MLVGMNKQNTISIFCFSLEVIYHKINRDLGCRFSSQIVVCSLHVTSYGYGREYQVRTWGHPTHILRCLDFNFSVTVRPNSSKMKETINSYANSLIEIWEKPFTSNHVLRCKALVKRLEKLVSLYYKVYNVANRMSSKHKSFTTHPKSIQFINKQWKQTSIEFIINDRKMLFPITSMLDTVKDKTLLGGAKKVFYNDQKHARVCRPSEEIDEAWVAEQLIIFEHQSQEQDITDYVFTPEEEIDIKDNTNDLLDTSVTQSGLRRIVITDMATQIEYQYLDKPPMRSICDCSLEIKKACVKVPVKCGI